MMKNMGGQTKTLTTILLLLAAGVGICVFVLTPGLSDSVGIILAGLIGYCAVQAQGELILAVMGKAIRHSKPIVVVIPAFRAILLRSFQAIGLPIISTGLIAALASPPNAPPFIRSI